MPIRAMSPGEEHRVASILAKAFSDDPVTRFVFPSDRAWRRRSAAFYTAVARALAPVGRVDLAGDFAAAAIWREPGGNELAGWRGRLFTLRMAFCVRAGIPRAVRLGRALERVHPRERHWYLSVIGTDPREQGRGHASELIEPVLERCDAEGLPAYLESSKEGNVSFYRRFGFEVVEEVQVDGGPRIWPMWRESRRSGRGRS